MRRKMLSQIALKMVRLMLSGTPISANLGLPGIEHEGNARIARLPAVRNARWQEAESLAKRRTMEAGLLGIRSTAERALRVTTIKQQRRSCSTKDEERTSRDDRSGGQGNQQQEQQSKLTSLGAQFAELTNSVLQTRSDREIIDVLYDKFLQDAKNKIIRDLTKEHAALLYFYTNPSSTMPTWLSKLPPGRTFYIFAVDVRLESRAKQMKQDIRSFVEGQDFVCTRVDYHYGTLHVDLRLDMAKRKRERTLQNMLSRR